MWHNVVARHLLDAIVGMHVYTYPFDARAVNIKIVKPHHFKVSEVVNGADVEELFYRILSKGAALEPLAREGSQAHSIVYIVKKVNVSTLEAAFLLDKILECKDFEVLGLKEAKAVAFQIIIFKGCKNLMRRLRLTHKDCIVDAVLWQRGEDVLTHTANRFDIEFEVDSIEDLKLLGARVGEVARHGFRLLNFFGYQRFGSTDPVTHLLGKDIVLRDWEGFYERLCRERPPRQIRNISPLTGPHGDRVEASVCKLAAGGKLKIPKRLLLLYLHAYQAYLFNVMLSKVWLNLIERYGFPKALEALEERFHSLPLVGCGGPPTPPQLTPYVSDVLRCEDIRPEDFCVNEIGISVPGDYRTSIMFAEGLSLDIGMGKAALRFTLRPGSYATVVLRELLRAGPERYL